MNPRMEDIALLERSPKGTMETVLKVQVAPPLDDMREEVTEERGILIEKRGKVESAFGGDELIEPDLVWRQLSPVAHPEAMVRVGACVPDAFENHSLSVSESLLDVPSRSSRL
jgi:hypothetical protein